MVMVIYIEVVGNPNAPRYMIRNREGQYWGGSRWGCRREGQLYSDVNDAAIVCNMLQRRQYENCKVTTRLSLPMEVEVLSDRPVSPESISSWLQQALSINVAYGNYGNGPTKDSLVLVAVDHRRTVLHE